MRPFRSDPARPKIIRANAKQALNKPRILLDHIELGYTGSNLVAMLATQDFGRLGEICAIKMRLSRGWSRFSVPAGFPTQGDQHG